MSSASPDFDSLYYPESSLAEPLKTLIAADIPGASIYTINNGSKLQKETGFILVVFQCGSANGHQKVFDAQNDVKRWDGWNGQYTVQVVTATNLNIHGTWVAKCRNVLGGIIDAQTAELFPYLCLNEVMDAGSTQAMKSADGYTSTTLTYKVDFNIRADAWPT